jgi:hypothetical protein
VVCKNEEGNNEDGDRGGYPLVGDCGVPGSSSNMQIPWSTDGRRNLG